MALSFTSNHEKMAFSKSDNYARLVKPIVPNVLFNFLGVSSVGTNGVVSRSLYFSDLPAVIAWCQNPANIASIINYLSNPAGGFPISHGEALNWTGSAIDFVNPVGPLGGDQEGWIIGGGAFGSGWWGFGSDAFFGVPVYTDAYWASIGSPPSKPHGTADLIGGNAFVGLLAMTITNTAWSYSAGSYYWLPRLVGAFQNLWGSEYKPIVPLTDIAANQWALMPMPNYDTSIFNNTAIPTGTNPSQYLVPGLMGVPVIPLLPGFTYAG